MTIKCLFFVIALTGDLEIRLGTLKSFCTLERRQCWRRIHFIISIVTETLKMVCSDLLLLLLLLEFLGPCAASGSSPTCTDKMLPYALAK